MALADFNHIKDVLAALDVNKPSRFGYTEAAITVTGEAEINAITGVFIPNDSTQINSIPDVDMVGMDPIIINTGLRTQAATIPRMTINHFFGRLGLNLLKLTEKTKVLAEEHLVNRYITPSGNITERMSVSPQADTITLIQHQSLLSASAPVTASAPITLPAAVYNGNAGVMTGADKKILDDLVNYINNEFVPYIQDEFIPYIQDEFIPYVEGSLPFIGAIIARVPGYFGNNANGSFTPVSITVSSSWKLCNGSLLNDPNSPLFNGEGRYLPNLTNNRFIMGSITPGSIGGVSSIIVNKNNITSFTPTGTINETNTDHYHSISHTHSIDGNQDDNSVAPIEGAQFGHDTGKNITSNGASPNTSGNMSANASHAHTLTMDAVGKAVPDPISIIPPYLSAEYYIRVK